MLERFSRSELLQLMELASKCLTVSTPEQLEPIISSIFDLSSFGKAALCAVTGSEDEVALAHYVNHSYGTQWAELYGSQNFQRIDPILLHASTQEGVFRWDEAAAAAASSGSSVSSRMASALRMRASASASADTGRDGRAAFLEAAQSFGIVDGLSFSCAGTAPGFRSVLSLTGVPAEEYDRITRVVTTIGPHLHEAYRRVLNIPTEALIIGAPPPEPVIITAPPLIIGAPPAAPGAASGALVGPGSRPAELAESTEQPKAAGRGSTELSAREREVLCWAQQGKTYWEIGCILGISQRTVKFHFARIKAKLDVVSTAHAIAKAMRSGLIT